MKILETIQEYNVYIVMAMLLIFTSIFVAKVNFNNGKIDVCKKTNNMIYNYDQDKCITCESLGGKWSRSNQCVYRENGQQVTDNDMKQLDPSYGVDYYG